MHFFLNPGFRKVNCFKNEKTTCECIQTLAGAFCILISHALDKEARFIDSLCESDHV